MFLDLNIGELKEAVSGRRWTPSETRQQIALRMAHYQSRGLEPGDRVLIHFGNRLEFFAELLAIWRLGACAIPVDARLTPYEIDKLITAADARFGVVDDATSTETIAALAAVQLVHTLEYGSLPEPHRPGPTPALDDDALILFTSGSTGTPKGVVHTHRSLRARWATLGQSLGLEDYRRTLCVLPTHFGHGLICNCLFPWLNGCDLIITPPFKADLMMKLGALIDEHEVSFMSSVPSVWNLALKIAAAPAKGTLRRLHVGSAPLSAAVWTQIQEWSGVQDVFNAYGITETGSWVAGTTGGPVIPEDGLIGEPWGATIKVLKARNPDEAINADAECAADEAGMIWLNTPALMKGYFQRQDLTDAVVREGWFMTGDIGAMDERGRLFIRGRERDEINKGGIKVFPADIDALVEQFKAVSDVCSFGYPDDAYGENVGMAIVLEDRRPQAFQGLYDWINQNLAEHKRPVRWYLLDEIPRTSRGKINRATVMECCDQQQPLDLQDLLSGKSRG